MDSRHTCKLCFRRFHNGRALGGHMRSHVMAASAVAAAAAAAAVHSLSPASTSSTEMTDGKPPPTTPRAKRRLETDEFSGGRASVVLLVVQDGESDTESSSPRFAVGRRRRSKRAARRRAPPAAPAGPEQPAASGVSDATPEEDVAMSLVMLSRDSWARLGSAGPEPRDDDPRGGGARHRCGVCGKVFRSYQALGGHRASVKRGKGGCVPVPPSPTSKIALPAAAAVHECPFCFRVFESGQALGGHKRAHMTSPWATAATKCGGESSGSIDLNVPAATTDDDDFEVSAVYDAEVGSTRQ